MRRREWKLVLKGRLHDKSEPQDDVFLSNIQEDPSESVNLKDQYPQIAAQLTEAAQSWRNKIEDCWENYWLPRHGRSTDWW